VDAYTLPKSNPIWELNKAKTMRIRARSMHRSPAMLMRIHVRKPIEEMETIEAFAIGSVGYAGPSALHRTETEQHRNV
jgi:hypothetical protein